MGCSAQIECERKHIICERRKSVVYDLRMGCLIRGPKTPLRTAKKAIVMISPREASSRPKALGDERLIMVNGRHGVKTSRYQCRTIWISKQRDLFGSEKKDLPLRVVGNIP